MFPALMGIMGLDKIADTIFEGKNRSLYLTSCDFIIFEVIVMILTIILSLQLKFGGCLEHYKSFDDDYADSASMEL